MAPTPTEIKRLLQRLHEFSHVPARPLDESATSHNRRMHGNRYELQWATRGELAGCIEALPDRQRDAIVSCTVGGNPFAVVAEAWKCAPSTIWREERRAVRAIAQMLGWESPEQVETAAD